MKREQLHHQAEGQRQHAEQGRLSAEEQRHTNEEVRQTGEDMREAAETRRASAESNRETAATTQRTLEVRLSQVEARLNSVEERLAQFAAGIRKDIAEIFRAMHLLSQLDTTEKQFQMAQHVATTAAQMFKDAEQMVQGTQRRNGQRKE